MQIMNFKLHLRVMNFIIIWNNRNVTIMFLLHFSMRNLQTDQNYEYFIIFLFTGQNIIKNVHDLRKKKNQIFYSISFLLFLFEIWILSNYNNNSFFLILLERHFN